jgi:three-Cys-motif partner protein
LPNSHYNWKDGPALIQQHTIAKHNILRSYLAAYFRTLASTPSQDVLRLTLVDGFAGGGQYVHDDTRQIVMGSPFIFLEATQEADYLINRDRKKPVHLDIDYFFIEANRQAFSHLDMVLRQRGFESALGANIHLRNKKFDEVSDEIIAFIKTKSPRNGRSIFVLDQYGYKDVPTRLIRNIFASLPSAEIILTFGVDSFLNYASDGELTKRLLDRIGVGDVLSGRSIEEIKSSEKDWRLFIQSNLYRALVDRCGAKHFTPFFIRNKKGHGDYWLIHLSQHHRARDVMTEVHWDNNNYFIHYGGAGIDMFQMIGYDPRRDSAFKGQSELGFEFNNVAHDASVESLVEQIPRHIYARDEGLTFGELFATTCNTSPATSDIYRSALETLISHKSIDVVSAEGAKRRSAGQIHSTDHIKPPPQKSLFLPE